MNDTIGHSSKHFPAVAFMNDSTGGGSEFFCDVEAVCHFAEIILVQNLHFAKNQEKLSPIPTRFHAKLARVRHFFQIAAVKFFTEFFRFKQVLGQIFFVAPDDEFKFVQIVRPAEAVENYFTRTSALFPCAPRPSSSANFFTTFSAFFSEARLYSTTLVRRWN